MEDRTNTFDRDANGEFRSRFGDAPPKIFEESNLRFTWRISFMANYLNLPLYRDLQKLTGLGRPQVVTLLSLLEQDGLQASEICLLTGQPKNTISRSVIELTKRGLINHTDHASDKRAKSLHLTDEGRAVIIGIKERFLSRQKGMREVLTEAERAMFDILLHKMLEAMPNWVDEGVEIYRLSPSRVSEHNPSEPGLHRAEARTS